MEECEKKEQRRDRRPCQPWREESVRVPKQTKTKTTLQDSDGSLNWSMRRHLGLSIKMTAGGISPSCRCYLTVCKVMKEKIKIDPTGPEKHYKSTKKTWFFELSPPEQS